MKKLYSKNAAVIIITLTGILFACKKTDVDKITDSPLVTASIAGLVTDTNNVAITNATVTAGTSVTTPDVNGRFTISNAQLDKDAGVVTISKSGYFTGARTFVPSAGTVNNVKIQLIPKTVAGNFDAGTGGTVNILGGGKVDFGSGSIVNASTAASFSGNVAASTLFLNSTDPGFKNYMPRDLQAIDASNNKGLLQSYGMAVVELNDASGNKLQLASGKTATITLPIASSLLGSAPASVPLWYFDDSKGVWKQEGTATKQGSNYVGAVKHFSFWSAGQLTQSVKLTATFKDSTGQALTNKLVWIIRLTNESTSGYTDNTGTVSGFVPANETLVLDVLDDCGNLMYKKYVGPFSTDTDLGNIIVSGSGVGGVRGNITLSGTAVDCNNSPIARGSVTATIVNVGQLKSAISNGAFNIGFNSCINSSNTATLYVYDSVNNLGIYQYNLTINSANQNIGQIRVCNSTPTVAGFTYSGGNTSLPVTVTFTNTSTNATVWLWSFGDGTTSPVENPAHTYTTSGDFTVSLTATGPAGSNTFSTVIHISGTVDESYINLTLNGTNFSWAPPDLLSAHHSDSVSVNHTLIQATGSGKSIYFYILNDNTSPGNYNITLSATLNGVSYPNNAATTTVTEYGIPGGYIIGTASGQMRAQDSTSYRPFSMSYKVKRNQ